MSHCCGFLKIRPNLESPAYGRRPAPAAVRACGRVGLQDWRTRVLIQSCCIFFLTWRACRIRLQYAPYILELDEATRYVWCQCGVSMKQPFCDSTSHRSSSLLPPDAMRALHAAFDLQQPCGAKNCMRATPPAPTPEFIRVRGGFDVDICVAWWGYTISTSNAADVAPPGVG
jgi:hypothetical protein